MFDNHQELADAFRKMTMLGWAATNKEEKARIEGPNKDAVKDDSFFTESIFEILSRFQEMFDFIEAALPYEFVEKVSGYGRIFRKSVLKALFEWRAPNHFSPSNLDIIVERLIKDLV